MQSVDFSFILSFCYLLFENDFENEKWTEEKTNEIWLSHRRHTFTMGNCLATYMESMWVFVGIWLYAKSEKLKKVKKKEKLEFYSFLIDCNAHV